MRTFLSLMFLLITSVRGILAYTIPLVDIIGPALASFIGCVLMMSVMVFSLAWLAGKPHCVVLDKKKWKPTAFKEFPPEQMKAPEPIAYMKKDNDNV